MSSKKLVSLGISLRESTYQKLVAQAETEQRSISSLIRVLLSKVLNEQESADNDVDEEENN